MEVIISGLLEEDALEQGYGAVSGATVAWLAPDDFIKRWSKKAGLGTDQCWIWLYRSPWSLLAAQLKLSTNHDILEEWEDYQRNILKMRHNNPEMLILINRDATTAHELFASLKLRPWGNEIQLSKKQHDLSTAFGKLFEWIAPPYWEIFEALEATARIPNGNPVFRDNLDPPSLECVLQISKYITAGRHLPELEHELAVQQQVAQDLQNKVKDLQVTVNAYNEIEQKNNLLVRQLHQSQEELKKSSIEYSNRCTILEEENKTQTQQIRQAHQQCKVLKEKLVKANDGEEKSSLELKDLEEKNDLLLMQLHQAQEEMQKITIAHSDRVTTLEKENRMLEQRAEKVRQQYEDLTKKFGELSEAEKKSATTLKELRKANEALRTEKNDLEKHDKEIEEENELLLLQLHQVQEELESHFLANKQMKETLIHSHKSMDQARLLLCRLAPKK